MHRRKLVIIGAGSASFTAGLVADLLASGIEAQWTIGLVDINEEALAVADGLVTRMVQQTGLEVAVQASTDRCDILPGADFVVTTIAVGGRDGWRRDAEVPLRHGIYQPVADTVGPGGISRALRQIPAMLDIANDVACLCPDAHFFNYANPMAAICRAVNKATCARVVGLCHGVQGTLRYLCEKIGVPYAEIASLYVGMNHLTWITHLTRGGEDLWPRIAAVLPRLDSKDNPFSWELCRTYGAFPAVLDRHVVEFFPERFFHDAEYGKPLVDEILRVINGGDETWERRKRQARGEEPLEEGLFQRTLGEHEALLPIIASILADRHEVFPMNVPNRTVDGIPRDFVLEMPVTATAAGCLPTALPPMPPGILAWVTEALYGVEITVEAAIRGDRSLVVQALLYDRSVPDLAAAEALADDLLAAQAEHLPNFA
ncbi:MAG: hypothetical protein FJX74_16030 [Armatimonadetes bacterium]|nr:hypothetical protein [Armatimonadota bacterium]